MVGGWWEDIYGVRLLREIVKEYRETELYDLNM